jgi:hypothetical protein
MARITKQDVWRVASEIDAGGDKPSVLEVRKRLGAGSYTTITAALREWVKPGADEENQVDDIPDEVSNRVEQFGADLYAMVYRIAQEQFDAQRLEYEIRIKALEAEKAEVVQIADSTEAALDVANAKLDRVSCELDCCLSDSKVLESRLDDAISDKERAIVDCANAQKEAGLLRGRLDVYEKRDPKPAKKKPVIQSKEVSISGSVVDQGKS